MGALVEILCDAHEFGVVDEVPHLHLNLKSRIRTLINIAKIIKADFAFTGGECFAFFFVAAATPRHQCHFRFLFSIVLSNNLFNFCEIRQCMRFTDFLISDKHEF